MLINREFFAGYWQKQPLLMRQAIRFPEKSLCKKSLFSLCEDETIETRLVLEHGERPWEVHFGPFDTSELDSLPASHWTILFQDMDKHRPEIATVLDQFQGMPRWRIDDIMISFATDQGSVGPHTDEYDVFLIQAEGKRHWQINTDSLADRSLVPDLDMKILQYFESEQEWLLEPGDVLYLPPGVAHWGVAEGECITWSVGFRAPSVGELFSHWSEDKLDAISDIRYSDPDLQIQPHKGEIQPQAIQRLRTMLLSALEQETGDFGEWFGRFITEPKENLQPEENKTIADAQPFLDRLQKAPLHRHPASPILFTQQGGRLFLFCGGESYSLDEHHLPFAILMSENDSWSNEQLGPSLEDSDCLDVILELFQQGYLGFE